MFGFLTVNKPPGISSYDVIRLIKRRIGKTHKIGHAGTLDPFAEGVLVVCLGQATRLVRFLAERPKQYRAQITLGATSTTDDPEGEISVSGGVAAPSEEAVRQVMGRFVGTIQQTPPAHSAVRIAGRRAYKLARAGQEFEITPRPVEIFAIELERYDYPRLQISVTCGGGTYIRALARDIGQALGVGGYCSGLVRTAVGPFRIEDARRPEELSLPENLVSPLRALEPISVVTLSPEQVREIFFGRPIKLESALPPGRAALTDQAGQLIALAQVGPDGLHVKPEMVFPAE